MNQQKQTKTPKLLYLDTETTGLDPKTNALIQISGIVTVEGDHEREFDFHLRPHPQALIDPKALETNRLTEEDLLVPERLEHKAVYKKLKSIFLTYINRYDKTDKFYLVGQNVHFDYGFLLALWERNQDQYLGSFIHYQKIDLIAITAALKLAGRLPVENMKLETLCRYFSLGEQLHDSLDDIRKTREIFSRYVEMMRCP
jgi:DNA polymerase-3 subunit epsilon